MPLLTRNKLVGAAVETTAGTAESVTTALADNIFDAKIEPGDIFSDGKRNPLGHYQGTVDAVAGKLMGTASLTMEVAPNSSGFFVLLQGCGYTVSSTTATANSDGSAAKSLTLALFEAGVKKTLYGAAGNVELKFSPGGRLMAEFSFTGIFETVPSDVALPTRAPIQTQPFVAKSMTATIDGGTTFNLTSEVSISLNAEAEERGDLTTASGLLSFFAVEGDPTMSLSPEAALVATRADYTKFLAGTTGAVQFIFTGSARTLTIDAARAQRTAIDSGDDGKKLTRSMTFSLHHSSGDDDLIITEAAAV